MLKPLATAFRSHWPEYLIEAACIGLFMVSACGFGVLLFHPASPAAELLPADALARRALMGLAMAATALSLIESPLGKRSGAHMNPATTITFFWLGRVAGADALGYVVGQCLGAISGVLAGRALFGARLADPAVRYVVTVPGPAGRLVAFAAEVLLATILMLVVLYASNRRALARRTGLLAAAVVFLAITFEAPLSGMSMNPARSLGSATVAGVFTAFWVYLAGPLLGMSAAAAIYVRAAGHDGVLCAKLHHLNDQRCIFRCRFHPEALR